MAKCKHQNEEIQSSGEIVIGPEICLVQNIGCADCGVFLRYVILSRRPDPDQKK